jgi:hypothetical protein
MSKHLCRFAMALWLISFAVPATTLPDGSAGTGAQLVLTGVAGVAFMFPIGVLGKPLLALGLMSNLLMAGELRRLFRPANDPRTLAHATVLIAAAVLNVLFMEPHARPFFIGLLDHPGFYLWASSFVLVAVVATHGHRQFFLGLTQRSLALGAVAVTVCVLGLAAILFVGP